MAESAIGDPGGLYASFLQKVNLNRGRADAAVLVPIMAALTYSVYKYRHIIPRSGLANLGATLALTVVLVPWSRLNTSSYMRRRELIVACLRLALTAIPVTRVILVDVASRLGGGAEGLLAPFLFLLGLVFTSHSLRLLVVGVGLPLRTLLHVAVQLAMVAVIWLQDDPVCEALLLQTRTAGQGPAGGAGAASLSAEGNLLTEDANTVGAAASGGLWDGTSLVAVWHKVFSMLSIFMPFPGFLCDRRIQPLEQCRRLVRMSQLCLGLLLPVLLHLVLESRAYCMLCRRLQGHGRQHHGGPPPVGRGCFVQGLYSWVWGTVESMGLFLKVWLVMVLLATVWEVVVTIIVPGLPAPAV